MKQNNKYFFHLLALAVVALWGTTFISTKVLLNNGLTPSVIFTIRFIMAYAGIWLLCLKSATTRKLIANNIKDELIFVLLGITGGSMYFYTENTALMHTQACNVSFIVCCAPLLTVLLTLIAKRMKRFRSTDGLEDVKLNVWIVIGTIFALTGMALMIFNGYKFELSPKGDILAFLAALCWSIYSMFLVHHSKKYVVLFTTRKVFFWGLITIIPFVIGELKQIDINAFAQTEVIYNLLFLGIVASLICFVLWNKVMEKLGNVTSTNYVYLNPIFTLVGSIIILHEQITPIAAVGSALILIGVILSGRR